jgi:hypothetical protein
LTRPTRLVEHRYGVLPASVPVDLTWNAPAECPTREAVVDEVARVLSTSHEMQVQVTARADVSRDDLGRWHAALRVSTRDAHGERALDAENCPAIASATAVIVAIAVEGGVPETVPPPTTPPAHPTSSPASWPQRESPSQLIVAASALLDAGMLPLLAPGFEAALGWAHAFPRWRIRSVASGSFFLPQDSEPIRDVRAPGEKGRFDLFTAAGRVCGAILQNALDLGPCLGAEIDVMTGAGAAGPAKSSSSTGAWLSGVGSLQAVWSFSRHVAILVRAEAFYSPNPVHFGLNYSPAPPHIDVYRSSQAGARGALGMEFRFF